MFNERLDPEERFNKPEDKSFEIIQRRKIIKNCKERFRDLRNSTK
jgi:hypothetical protein